MRLSISPSKREEATGADDEHIAPIMPWSPVPPTHIQPEPQHEIQSCNPLSGCSLRCSPELQLSGLVTYCFIRKGRRMTQTPESLVRRLIEDGFNQGQPRRRRRAHRRRPDRAPVVRPESRAGPEGVKAVIRSLHRSFSDFHLEIEDVAVVDDIVWLRMIGSGTHDGPYMGHEPTGGKMHTPVFDFLRVEDGKIVDHRTSPTVSMRSFSSVWSSRRRRASRPDPDACGGGRRTSPAATALAPPCRHGNGDRWVPRDSMSTDRAATAGARLPCCSCASASPDRHLSQSARSPDDWRFVPVLGGLTTATTACHADRRRR